MRDRLPNSKNSLLHFCFDPLQEHWERGGGGGQRIVADESLPNFSTVFSGKL